jgi:hypothetical protein
MGWALDEGGQLWTEMGRFRWNGSSPPKSSALRTMINFVFFLEGRLNPLKTALVGANKIVEESREDPPDSFDPESPSDIVRSSFEVDAMDGLNLLFESLEGFDDRFLLTGFWWLLRFSSEGLDESLLLDDANDPLLVVFPDFLEPFKWTVLFDLAVLLPFALAGSSPSAVFGFLVDTAGGML